MLTAARAGSDADVESYVGRLLEPAEPLRSSRVAAPEAPRIEGSAVADPDSPSIRASGATRGERGGAERSGVGEREAEHGRRASDRVERWIGFSVAGQAFGVEVLRVLEVQRLSEITPVPGAAPELMGAINLRGQIVPVLDLGHRLGFGSTELGSATRIIIVDYSGQPAGLCVGGVSEVISASASSIERTPPLGGRIADGWVRGVLRSKGEMVLLLDPVRLLADVELESAAES